MRNNAVRNSTSFSIRNNEAQVTFISLGKDWLTRSTKITNINRNRRTRMCSFNSEDGQIYRPIQDAEKMHERSGY